MIKKTVEFATPGTRLSFRLGQIVIDRPSQPPATLPIEDLGVVVVDDRQATLTQSLLNAISQSGAVLVVTGDNHLPSGQFLPLDGHHALTERHRAQARLGEATRKRLWQALVAAKIRRQGEVLLHFSGRSSGLIPMSDRVKSGDPDNLEAQAARLYWPALFGRPFRRDRDQAGVNAALNYGYALVRAATARAIVGSGLIPTLGLFHTRRSNAFCLADDLMEPFRPVVDWRVRKLSDEVGDALDLSDRSHRAVLLSIFSESLMVAGRRTPLLVAIQQASASLGRVILGEDRRLVLPSGLPLEDQDNAEAG
jgi:CRISPR-associated protein Cas1